MGFDTAALIEPLACCLRAIDRSGVKAGDFVHVVGAGPVGLAHALALMSMGAGVAVSDVSRSRLDFAEGLGVTVAVDARGPPKDLMDATSGRGADVSIVASGAPAAIVSGLKTVRRGGTVCLFGIPARGSVLDYDVSLAYNSELKVVSSYGATEADTGRAMELLALGDQPFSRLITHRFPLKRFDDALELAASGAGMKTLITP